MVENKNIIIGIGILILILVLGPKLNLFSVTGLDSGYISNEPTDFNSLRSLYPNITCEGPSNTGISICSDSSSSLMFINPNINCPGIGVSCPMSKNQTCSEYITNLNLTVPNNTMIYGREIINVHDIPLMTCNYRNNIVIVAERSEYIKAYLDRFLVTNVAPDNCISTGVGCNSSCTYGSTRICTMNNGTSGIETCRAANGVNVWDGDCKPAQTCVKGAGEVVCGKCYSGHHMFVVNTTCTDMMYFLIGGIIIGIILLVLLFRK